DVVLADADLDAALVHARTLQRHHGLGRAGAHHDPGRLAGVHAQVDLADLADALTGRVVDLGVEDGVHRIAHDTDDRRWSVRWQPSQDRLLPGNPPAR